MKELIRKNIRELEPYKCARDEFSGEASVYLDANESPYNAPYDRYPDPLQLALKAKIAKLKGTRASQIMLGVGSDEPIDLIERIFCEPQVDNIVAIAPSYGMYGVEASVNNVEFRQVALNADFSLNVERMLAAADAHTKVMFVCSPNNPTGNLLQKESVRALLEQWDGIVVVDEAYIDFAGDGKSWLSELDKYEKLIVLQTFSKAWAMAGARCGMAFASEEIISVMNNVKYPYNLSLLVQQYVSEQLDKTAEKEEWVRLTVEERKRMEKELNTLKCVVKTYPSDANFLLTEVTDAVGIYRRLVEKGIIVRNRNSVKMCEGCLRITIGTREENDTLLNELRKI